MKNKLFRKHASVIPTGAPTLRSGQAARSGGIPSFRRFLATLGMTALFCWSATAQNGVTVSNLVVEPGTVTFNVSWKKADMPTVWSDSVWVFVDYNDAGVMKRLPVTDVTVSAGTVEIIPGNSKGVRVIGNARTEGSFSATVQMLTATADLSGVCAYASNYPPVGEYIDAAHISFTGTPMYKIVLEETAGEGILIDYSDGLYLIREGYTIKSFTDTTGAPGIMKCMLPATYTLQASALSFCAGSEGVQFALSGTEDGRHYQLYRDGVAVDDAVLDGTDNASTFTGSFDEAGTYTAQTIADGKYCAIAMNGTHVVVENLLPAAPTVFNGSRNCPGTVTLTASSSPAAVIDWYVTVDAASSVHTGTSYTTPEIDESTTYYVQARFENTGCLSERVPVLATVITENCCHAPGTTVNFTTFNPCAAAAGATWALVDTREANLNPANPQTYTAKKMADGHIWLVQDLKFGNLCGITFSGSSGGNQTGKVSNAPGTYYGDCTAATNTSTPSARGYMYDWAAAINKSGAYYGSSSNVGCSGTLTGATGTVPGACQGICPAGWHIPTGGSSGEFKALHNAQGCATNNDNCWDASSAWQGTYNGWTAANGSLADGGSYGFYWSSTYGSANNAYMLAYRSNKTMVDVYNGSDCCNGYKYYGWGVRCVMNY